MKEKLLLLLSLLGITACNPVKEAKVEETPIIEEKVEEEAPIVKSEYLDKWLAHQLPYETNNDCFCYYEGYVLNEHILYKKDKDVFAGVMMFYELKITIQDDTSLYGSNYYVAQLLTIENGKDGIMLEHELLEKGEY